MNWVLFSVLLGFGLLNLLGVGIYHYQYARETHKVVWYKDKTFWLVTVYNLFVGVTYVVLNLIYILMKYEKKNE